MIRSNGGRRRWGLALLHDRCRLADVRGHVVAAIDHTRVEHNQYGIESDGSTHTTIRDSVAENQSLTGFGSFGGADVQIKDSVTAHNYYGFVTDSTMRVSNTLVNNNVVAISGPVISWGNNSVAGNSSSEMPRPV